MDELKITRECAVAGVAAGRAIRAAVHAMDLGERARPVASRLKANNVAVDALAEDIGLDHLRALAARVERRLLLLLDDRGAVEVIGDSRHSDAVWVCFDAVDGTKKLAGIAAQKPGRLAAANDGAWAATFAFTAPTPRAFADLTFADFRSAVIVDGNPTQYRAYPREVLAAPGDDGVVVSHDVETGPRVHTTSCETLSQCWAFLDAFQAYDRDTHAPGDEQLAVEIYRLLIDRHAATGAYDVLRQFGSLSALCRTMLGWREKPVWLESQGGAMFVVNENLPNLIPSVAIVAAAGGVSVDFDGCPLLQRRLAEGRTSVIHAANAALREQCLRVVTAARARR